jgi:hypothetical protein
MVMLEAAFVLGLLGLIIYGSLLLLARSQEARSPASVAGHWRVAHYDREGQTRVVLQKVTLEDTTLLDEHLVAVIGVDDPEYDARFLAAMSTARERRALFETEEES